MLIAKLTLAALYCLPPAWAQGTGCAAEPGAAVRPPVAVAQRVSESPAIDGVLDEAIWQQATPLTDFVQAEPLEGQPASEKTEVRVVYDEVSIFIGIRLLDDDPSQIVITDTWRDAALNDQDSFQVIFDTFRDRQNGFVFGTNASGVQYDGQVRNQGNPSTTWDGSWDVRTQHGESGWTARQQLHRGAREPGPAEPIGCRGAVHQPKRDGQFFRRRQLESHVGARRQAWRGRASDRRRFRGKNADAGPGGRKGMMASPVRNILAGSAVATLLAILLAAPTIDGIRSWEIVLAAIGLLLFMLSSRRGAATK